MLSSSVLEVWKVSLVGFCVLYLAFGSIQYSEMEAKG